MKKEFDPRIELFDPFKEPFSGETQEEKELAACCACTACCACSACK